MIGQPPHRCLTRQVDDRPAAALDHAARDHLRDDQDGADVDRHRRVEGVDGRLQQGLRNGDAGVVDQQIDGAGLLGGTPRVPRLAQIRDDRAAACLGAEGVQILRGAAQRGDLRPELAEEPGDFAPDPLPRARHQRALAAEVDLHGAHLLAPQPASSSICTLTLSGGMALAKSNALTLCSNAKVSVIRGFTSMRPLAINASARG